MILSQQEEARLDFVLGAVPGIPVGFRPVAHPHPVDNLRDLVFVDPEGASGRPWRSSYGTGTHRSCPAADDLRSGREAVDTNPRLKHDKDLLGPRNGEHELAAPMYVPPRRTEHTERFKGREIGEFGRGDHL